jgi:hypothetical protein
MSVTERAMDGLEASLKGKVPVSRRPVGTYLKEFQENPVDMIVHPTG